MKPRTSSGDDDCPFLPNLEVYEPEEGLKTYIGFFPLKEEAPEEDPNDQT